MMDRGIAIIGAMIAFNEPKNRNITTDTMITASKSVCLHLLNSLYIGCYYKQT